MLGSSSTIRMRAAMSFRRGYRAGPRRHRNRKCRASRLEILGPHTSPIRSDEAARDCQPHARAGHLVAKQLAAIERLEQPLELVRLESRAVVAHFHAQPFVVGPRAVSYTHLR